jgi:hypothetical protein
MQESRATFDVTSVTAIANGHWWHARNATGHGTVDFKVPEGNGHTTLDMIQATVASQPTALAENNSVQFRMRNTVNANPSFIATAGAVQAGWATATYLAMWLRLPDSLGIITSSNTTYFQHFLTTGNQRRLVFSSSNSATNTSDRVTTPASVDGISNGTSSTYDTPFDGGVGPSAAADWVWCEVMCDPLLVAGGSAAADKMKLFFNLVRQTQTIAPSIDFTALFDAAAPIQIASRASGLANVDTTDWAACYYGNGIPTEAERRSIAGYYPPRTITF